MISLVPKQEIFLNNRGRTERVREWEEAAEGEMENKESAIGQGTWILEDLTQQKLLIRKAETAISSEGEVIS